MDTDCFWRLYLFARLALVELEAAGWMQEKKGIMTDRWRSFCSKSLRPEPLFKYYL